VTTGASWGGGMDVGQMQAAFEAVFDEALVFHGFLDYMRDYEMVIERGAHPQTGSQRHTCVMCSRTACRPT